jgi:endoglucanase
MRITRVPLVAAALLLLVIPAGAAPPAKGFARVQGQQVLGPGGSPILLRGMNLGNWLVPEGYMFQFEKGPTSARQIDELVRELVGPAAARAFWKDFRDAYITRDDVQYLRKIGLNSIRVPFDFRVLTPEDQPDVWLEDGFQRLDSVIAWAKEAGLLVVLDMHCAPGGQTGANIDNSWGYPYLFVDADAQARTVAIWKRLAARYRDEPAVLGYDLLNEPIPSWPGLEPLEPALEPLLRRIVAGIREVDPHHVVFLTGARWDTKLDVLGAPFDANAVYTFHKYWNETTDASLQDYLAFGERHHVPLWLGESGENEDAWIADCVRLVERHGIGWAFWPYKKMDSPRGVVSIARPPYWDEIVAYAQKRVYDPAENYKLRPPADHVKAALAGLVENARFKNVRINEGYVRALGMTP